MNSVIRPRARDDIIRQFRWYLVNQDAADAAYRFLDPLEESIQQLLSMPGWEHQERSKIGISKVCVSGR